MSVPNYHPGFNADAARACSVNMSPTERIRHIETEIQRQANLGAREIILPRQSNEVLTLLQERGYSFRQFPNAPLTIKWWDW